MPPSQGAGYQVPGSTGFGGPGGGPGGAGAGGFGAAVGGAVSGRMGEQGGLRTGWLAAFGTEGYDGEPPLLEELGINFGHIRMKVGDGFCCSFPGSGLGCGFALCRVPLGQSC